MKNMGKHVVITGGSSGIGKSVAIRLAQEGWNLSIISRDETKLKHALSEIKKHCIDQQQKIFAYAADVSQEQALTHAIQQAVAASGTPDMLITSAGIACADYFQNLTGAGFKRTMDINYFGTVNAVRAIYPYMRDAHKGQIVMIASASGLFGTFGYGAYSPSKFAVRGLAESLRPEFKQLGINLSIVYPPDTDTPQLHEEELTRPEEAKRIIGTVKPWPADKVADCIMRGIKKKQFHITPGFPIWFLRFAHSFIFRILNCYFDSLLKSPKRSNLH